MKKILFILALLLFPLSVLGQTGALQGTSTVGGISATTQGAQSSNKLQGVIPAAKISIYLTGTQTLATLTSDGTHSLSNPFYSNASNSVNPGGWIAFAATNIGLDVVASSGQGTPNCVTGPLCYTQPVTLCKDCFASSQFVAPGVVSITGANGLIACTGGSCNITGQGAILQHNGTNLTDQALLNFLDAAPSLPAGYTPVTFSSDGYGGLGGYIPPTSVGSGLTMAVNGSPATQYVIVRPSSGTSSCPSGSSCVTGPSSALLQWYCTGVFCNLAPNTTANWVFTGSSLPAGVSAGSVTAIYAYSINSANSTVSDPIGSSLTCNSQNVEGGATTWEQAQRTSGALSGITGSNFTGVTCAATLIAGGAPGPSGLTMNVPDIGLIVAYTGTPVTPPATVYVATPLYFNPILSTLGIDTSAFQGALTLTTVGASGAATLSGNTLNIPNYSTNGLSGMTAGQVPLAATASTVTSSEALAGSGAGITTGPTSGTSANDVVLMNGTNGQIKDGGTLASLLPSQYKTWSCQPGLGDGLNAITAGTYLQATCKNTTGVTVTLTGLQCFTDNSGSSTLNAAGNTLGALLTGAVTCTSSFAAGAQSANVLLTNGDYIKLTFVADGTSKQATWVVTGTY